MKWIRRLHPGQLAVLWLASVLIAFVLLRQRTLATEAINKAWNARIESITAPRSYERYYTPEQLARADSYRVERDAAEGRAIQKVANAIRLKGFLVIGLTITILTVTWIWFSARHPDSSPPN